MHRQFRKLLDDAIGEAKFVVAANIDVRGFSDWSLRVDSAQTALYIKTLYARLIDEYFPDPAFATSTGDGLLVVIPFEQRDLEATVRTTISHCIEIVDRFPTICTTDPMINFEVPENVGIGVSRGSASRLTNRRTTLDYSGSVLNLATRLMDLARPRGVVVDAAIGTELLEASVLSEFRQGAVYLKGVAPNDPLPILIHGEDISIPAINSHPIGEEVWKPIERNTTLKHLQNSVVDRMAMTIPQRPLGDNVGVILTAFHPAVTRSGGKSTNQQTEFPVAFNFSSEGGEYRITYSNAELAGKLSANGVKPAWPVRLIAKYRVT